MMRNFKILISQFQTLSWQEFGGLLKKSLFFNESIVVFMQDIVATAEQVPDSIDDIRIVKGDLSDLEQAEQTLNPIPWEFQCHKYDGVKDFFVAKNIDSVQHISWIYFHNHRNRLLSLGEREAEIKFCLTLPALRGRGIYPTVIRKIMNYLNSKGLNRVYMCVHKDNHPSIRGIEKAGFRRVGEIRLRKLMGVQISPCFDTSRVK